MESSVKSGPLYCILYTNVEHSVKGVLHVLSSLQCIKLTSMARVKEEYH